VSESSGKPLRLLAHDAEDLSVISAALQDAVARIGDVHWDASARQLTIAFNRFRWEAPQGRGERVRSGLQIGCVLELKARKIRREAPDAVLELLALSFEPMETPGGLIVFAFAGDADLAVAVECIDAVLVDVSAPWRTAHKPAHG
jgi:hypothetical protein